MAGTKTNTPIMQTPQSISVIGSEQIRDQKPGKFDEILRYTPGVVAGTFGADTRNDWFLIRGFKSDDVGLFLDGLQLFYTSYASWKLQPFNLARVEVLRGPSAVLYGGSSPSGIVNAVSKTPPAEPIRYLETGVNNFGNAYLSFDFGGPVATAPENGKLFYRVVGQVQNGGTQVDFTPDNNYFIAPSVTYKPDADTTFTVLASASKTRHPRHQLPALCGNGGQRTVRPHPDEIVRRRPQRRYVQARTGDDRLSVRAQSLRQRHIPAERPLRARRPHLSRLYRQQLYQRRSPPATSAATIGTRRTPPTRAIWTTSWNIVSIPARCSTRCCSAST